MNKNEAINQFIKKYFKFLTSGDFDKKVLKTYIKDYFVTKHNKKYGIPNHTLICDSLIRYQLKYRVGKDTLVEEIKLFPIYKYISDNKRNELIATVNNNYDSGLSDDEVARISNMSTIEAAKTLQKDKIVEELREETKELEEQKLLVERELENKKEETLLYQSILDDEPPSEPDFDPEIEYVKQWWERFYLKDDPFPGNKDGLARVDESLYESVVSKSRPYIELLNKLNINPGYLFHTSHLLIGDFGFGKTTFQDYLIHYLAKKNILPLRITCLREHPDSNGYHDHFIVNLKRKLLKNCEQSTIYEIEDLPSEEAIIEICKSLSETRRGVIVFLDDYHKFIKNYDAVYDFLGSLQPLKDELTRNDCNVGFVVSGVPKWERQLSSNRQLSGFFDSPLIRMPAATVDFIMDIFNRRISAYCYDSEPRTISATFVEKLFDSTNGQSSYRDYLNLIIEELERDNLSIINTPIEINEESLANIKDHYVKDNIVGTSLNKLIKESNFKKFNQEQIHKCLELLVVINSQEHVSESDRLFSDNMYYFNRLKECGLIQKRKVKGYEKRFVWVASKRLTSISNEVRKQHGYSFPDYFLKIFSHSTYSTSRKINIEQDNNPITRLKADLINASNKLEQSAIENIGNAFAQYDRFDTDPSDRRRTTSAISSMLQAFENLSNALYSIDNSMNYFINSGIYDMRERWEQHPVGSDVLVDMLNKVSTYENERDSVSYSVALTTAKGAFEYLSDYVRTTINDHVNSDIQLFRYRHNIIRHNDKDISIFETIKSDMYTAVKESHFNYIAQITNHLENTIRSFLYATTSLCFGANGYSKHIPDQSAIKYAHKNVGRKNMTSYNNLYSGLTRPQYRNIFTQGSLIKDLIIKKLDISWTSEHWNIFFDIFIEENISTSHQKFDAYSTRSRERYITYCNLAQQLIGAMNSLVSEIVTENVYLNHTDTSITQCTFKVGFNKASNTNDSRVNVELSNTLKKNDKLETYNINEAVFQKISNNVNSKLASKEFYIEDLLDIEYIQTHYGYSYNDFILSLAYLNYIDKSVNVRPWFGSKIIISKSHKK